MTGALEERRGIAGLDDRKSHLDSLRQARPRIRADVRDVGRGTLARLAAGDWIRQGTDLIAEGPTGSGRTFPVRAPAHRACHRKMSVPCRRVPEPVPALAHARDGEPHGRLMRRLARVPLPVPDGWGLQGFSAEGRRDLPETAGQRYGRRSVVIASQIPADPRPGPIREPTVADATRGRIVHNACRIGLAGGSRRRRNAPPPLDGSGA